MGVKSIDPSKIQDKLKIESDNIIEKLSSPEVDTADKNTLCKETEEVDLLEHLRYFPKLEKFENLYVGGAWINSERYLKI